MDDEEKCKKWEEIMERERVQRMRELEEWKVGCVPNKNRYLLVVGDLTFYYIFSFEIFLFGRVSGNIFIRGLGLAF